MNGIKSNGFRFFIIFLVIDILVDILNSFVVFQIPILRVRMLIRNTVLREYISVTNIEIYVFLYILI